MSTELAPVFEFPTELATSRDDLIMAWLAGRNEATQLGYLSDLGQFQLWTRAPTVHAAVEALLRAGPGRANEIIISYHAYMKEKSVITDGKEFKGLSSATINRRLAAIRSIVKFGRTIGLINWSLDVSNEKKSKDEKRRDTSGPDLADTRLLFRAADAMGDGKLAKRDRAIAALLFDLGLRRAEVCRLDLADVELNLDLSGSHPLAVWVIGKGKTERKRITLPKPTAELLLCWIDVRGYERGPLFHRCDGHDVDPDAHITGETIRGITARLSAMAGLKRVRPHGLRHSAATTLLDQGCRVQDVQKFGRWATLDMVLTYEDARHDTAGELAGLLARRRQDSKGKPRRP